MVKVRLTDVTIEHKKKEWGLNKFGQKGARWYASVVLHLVNEETGEPVAEWFYLVVCSQEYLNKPFRQGPVLDKRYLIVQDEFNLDNVAKTANERVANIKANSWDEFYSNMEKEFLHDD